MKQTPLQIVNATFGSKNKLVDQLAGKIAKREGESKEAFRKRLSGVSCGKLLRLQQRSAAKKSAKS